MARKVRVRKVKRIQARQMAKQGATADEIEKWLPILTAQIGQESRFQQGVGSPAGARDIAQFMPGTAPGYGVTLGDNKIRDDLRGQVKYMLPLLRKHGVEDALRGYNAGVGAIDASRGYSETNDYVDAIMGNARRYDGVPKANGAGGNGAPGGRRATSGVGMDPLEISIGGEAEAGPDPMGLLQAIRGLRTGKDSPIDFVAMLQGAQGTAPTTIELPGLTAPAGEGKGSTPTAKGGGGGGNQRGPGRAVAEARQRLGIGETAGNNRGQKIDKWQQRYGMLGQPWCGIFVGLSLEKAGVDGIDSSVASTAAIEANAKAGKAGFASWHDPSKARQGDALMVRPGGANGHVGLVERVDRKKGLIYTIEGNTSNGKVERRVHRMTEVHGVARPRY